jgi:hypothetical protein
LKAFKKPLRGLLKAFLKAVERSFKGLLQASKRPCKGLLKDYNGFPNILIGPKHLLPR